MVQGMTWNPITGCLNGCPYCYARKLANGRLKSGYLANSNVCDQSLSANDDPFYPRFWEDRVRELDPTWKSKHFTVGGASKVQPKGIFVCDMSDLFGIGIPEEWTRRVLDVIKSNPQHRFYLLTKQPQNLIKFSPFPPNCYVGVTATNAKMFKQAIEGLSDIKAKIKYVSLEPMLERIYHELYICQDMVDELVTYVDWVIIGAQTKPYKPPKIEWVSEIVRACDKAGVPVFLKDNLKPLLGRDYSKGVEGYAPQWAYTNHKLRQETPK